MQIVTVLLAVVIFLILIWVLVAILLFARKKLVPEGKAKIKINQEKEIETDYGCTLLQALTNENILMPSGCGGGGTCGTCKGIVRSGGGSLLPTETVHINRKMAQDQYRLFCQVKVKNEMEIEVPQEIFSARKWNCEVVSNRNVATFIKELVVKLPEGETIDFRSGGYVQVDIPKCYVDFKELKIDEKYKEEWEQLHIFELNMKNTTETVRAYSMANHPQENNRIVLNVRIATPPFDKKKGAFQQVKPGIGSSYIYSLQTGDKVTISGPYGDFFIRDTQNEMMFIGGGAGMAPMRSHIFDLFKTKHTQRKTSFWYGGRSFGELFYMDDFQKIANEYDNFTFQVALSDPKKEDQWTGYVGFIHQVIWEHYLKEHSTPEEIEYYICGPPMMLKAVLSMLAALGVPPTMIFYDDFGN